LLTSESGSASITSDRANVSQEGDGDSGENKAHGLCGGRSLILAHERGGFSTSESKKRIGQNATMWLKCVLVVMVM